MGWQRAGRLADLPVAATRPVTVADEAILLCRPAEKEVYAIEDCCSHDDASLAGGELDGRQIVCPRHGARFDLTSGAVLQMPAPVGITVYPVRLTADGWIEVEV